MDTVEFAAQRDKDLNAADDLLRDVTKRALFDYATGEDKWYTDLVSDATGIWDGHFGAEAPRADPTKYRERFQKTLIDSLEQTELPDNPPSDAQVERVLRWVSTYLINDATFQGTGARGGRSKKWVTMHDNAVRATHVAADGQIQPIGAPFNVGGYELRFPGDPVGPPSIWINCRCVVQPAARTGEANVSPTTFAITDEVDVDEELPVDELEEGEEEVTEIPVHGVLAPEGVPTGDGRQFAENALTNRDLPLPIAYQLMSADGHSNSVTVGRIDDIFRQGNEMRFRGALVMTKDQAPAVVEGILDGTIRGISVDVDNIEVDMSNADVEVEDGKMPLTVFSSARIAGVTIVPIPAFQEAYISLGAEFADELSPEALAACAECAEQAEEEENEDIIPGYDDWKVVDLSELSEDELASYDAMTPEEQDAYAEERGLIIASAFAPGTHDGPGWITHPIPTGRIRRYWVRGKGALKIRWGQPGDFNRCRRQLAKYIANPKWLAGACANMHKEAIGVWPGREGGKKHHALAASAEPAPIFNLVAAAKTEYPHEWFENPGLAAPAGVIVDGQRVYGYVATWGVCHVGIADVCTTAPHSASNYAYFNTGVVNTTEGPVRVGQITMDTGHASIRANARVAASHYDNTGSAVADVTVGEDSIGIWFAGVLRNRLSQDKIDELAAAGRLSGDWRQIGGSLELVAALAVNVPGFPIPHSIAASGAEGQYALVAAGIPDLEEKPKEFAMDAAGIAAVVRTAVDEYRHAEKIAAKAAPLRESLRAKRLQALRSQIKE